LVVAHCVGLRAMSDHQDKSGDLPERDSGRTKYVPRSDLEHAAREVMKHRHEIVAPSNCLALALDNLKQVLGDKAS
jgi:hypothetical protein